jgi:hypothetical protein
LGVALESGSCREPILVVGVFHVHEDDPYVHERSSATAVRASAQSGLKIGEQRRRSLCPHGGRQMGCNQVEERPNKSLIFNIFLTTSS